MRRLLALSLPLVLTACGGGSPTAPVASPVPTPAPTPTPTPNPYASACGTPLPDLKDSYGFKVKAQLQPSLVKFVLNASPQINNTSYCLAAGLSGNFCNTRNENDPTRVSCDFYVTGVSDTGRPGPNWYEMVNGTWVPCQAANYPKGTAPDCYILDTNQFLVAVYAGGIYKACGGVGSTGTCGACVIDQSEFGRSHRGLGGICQLYDGSLGR